ncbi:MAG: YicC/YloC family endoribonuclease [Gammaproteobacteria bacterium]
MIRSMTAFARTAGDQSDTNLVWELRSVNHRYLDITARLPEELRSLEPLVREKVAAKLGRGKLECHLRYDRAASGSEVLHVDQERLTAVLSACREVEKRSAEASSPATMDLLRWPGVVMEAKLDVNSVTVFAIALLEQALDELIATRQREGDKIADLLTQRCSGIEAELVRARQRLPDVQARIRDKLTARLAEFDVSVDSNRLEQELVFLAQKMDVDEELERLQTHVEEVRRVLGRTEPVGRRLDFLMQELNREANTLGSKSADPETTSVAVELKVLIEQMREQVQNIE